MSPFSRRGQPPHSAGPHTEGQGPNTRDRPASLFRLPPEPFRLGPCTLLDPVGSGGAGVVYRARLEQDREYGAVGDIVAVKVLDPSRIESATVFQRFLREANLGRSVDHPAIVRTYESGHQELPQTQLSYHYLVMEWVRGETLREVMLRRGPLPAETLRTLATRIADGLDAIHGAGAAHRDLKPGNVLVTPGDNVKLMDLGVAYLMQESTRLTREGYFVGTLLYASPEQIRGQAVGPEADLYSLGAVLYEAATAVQPFEAPTTHGIVQRHMRHVPPRAGVLNSRIPPWLEEVIACLLEKEPEQRFARASELRDVLRDGEASAWWQQRRLQLEADKGSPPLTLPVNRRAPFVGRFRELQTLRALYRDAHGGHGRVLVLEGEAGIGKTRLLDQLVAQATSEKEPAAVLYGSHKPMADAGPGPGALARAVIRFFRLDIEEEDSRQRIEAHLSRYLSAVPRLVPGFAALLAGLEARDGEALSATSVQAVYVYLASVLSAQQPLVWLVDDLDLASDAERSTFYALARQSAQYPMLLVGTTRPGLAGGELDEVLATPHVRRLSMGRLSPRQIQHMLEGYLGSPQAAAELSNQLAERCDGNPFFMLEMVRHLEQRGVLQRSAHGESLELVGELDPAVVPASVRELLWRRLQGLPPQDRELLEAAAVQGFSFRGTLLASAIAEGDVSHLPRSLDELHRRLQHLATATGLIHATDNGYHFDHHHLQEVVYASLSAPRRAQLHGALAQALEALHRAAPNPSPDSYAHLGRHFLRAGEPQRVLPYITGALDHLAHTYRHEDLLELADGVLEILDTTQPRLRCEIRLHQSRCLELRGRWSEAHDAAEDALAAARAAAAPRLLARAQLSLGRMRAEMEDHRGAQRLLEAAVQAARAADDGTLEAEAVGALGAALAAGGELEDATHNFQRQRQLATDLGDARLEGLACAGLGRTVLGQGDWGSSLELTGVSVERFEAAGVLEGSALALVLHGRALYGVGRWSEARSTLDRGLAAARRIGFAEGAIRANLGIAAIALGEGRLQSAQRTLDTLVSLCRSRGLEPLEGTALRLLGHSSRARGDFHDAERLYTEAWSLEHRQGACRGIARAAFALARLLAEHGDRHSAEPLLREALELAQLYRLAHPSVLAAVYLHALGFGDDAPAVAELGRLDPIARAEGHLLLWGARGDDSHLEPARDSLATAAVHLSGETRERFLRYQPVARALARIQRRETALPERRAYLRIARRRDPSTHY